ncbi:MAG: hypothetical protein NTW21_06465 [Verrucomicrobia bacterium]|nr:hypothetical protein [Verrucomicrobiota bacterium]
MQATFRNPGGGIVYGNSDNCYFTIRHSYALDESRKLSEVPQPMYYINKSFKADSDFPIQHSMNEVATVTKIDEGSDILIVALAYKPVKQATSRPGKVETNQRDWYLIKSQSGLIGWIEGATLRRHVNIPGAG